MKRTLAIVTIVLFTAVSLGSCAAGARTTKNGCYQSQGFVGYGGR